MRLCAAITPMMLCLWASSSSASSWAFDAEHSNIGFSVRHAMISNVRGTFRTATGTLELDDKDLTKSKLELQIQVDSVDTHNDRRDGHLKSPDFFDAGKFPTITYHATKVERQHGGLKVTGDLTLHGVTKQVVLHVEGPTKPIKDPFGMTRSGASVTAKLKRKEFGLKWSQALETGGMLVADEVNIQIDAEFVKQVPATAVPAPSVPDKP